MHSPGEPHLEPLFPIDALTPHSHCPHHGPIRRGSSFVCMICHQSGQDGHRALKRSPVTDPKPDPKPTARPRKLTRKEKRSLLRHYADRPECQEFLAIHATP